MRGFVSLLFALTIITACSNNDEKSSEPIPEEVPQNKDTVLVENRDAVENAFPELFTYYGRQDSSFSPALFSLNEIVTIDTAQSYGIEPKLKAFYPYLIYNTDSSLAIDLYSYSYVPTKREGKTVIQPGGADSEVAMVDLKNESRKRILFNGPSIIVLDAKWLNEQEIIVAGAEDIGHNNLKPVLWKVNLVANSMQLYTYPDTINARVVDYLKQALGNGF